MRQQLLINSTQGIVLRISEHLYHLKYAFWSHALSINVDEYMSRGEISNFLLNDCDKKLLNAHSLCVHSIYHA